MAKKKTQAELQREENEALGGFIQVDTLPGNVIDCTPRSVKKKMRQSDESSSGTRSKRRAEDKAKQEEIRRQYGAFSYVPSTTFKRLTSAPACALKG